MNFGDVFGDGGKKHLKNILRGELWGRSLKFIFKFCQQRHLIFVKALPKMNALDGKIFIYYYYNNSWYFY